MVKTTIHTGEFLSRGGVAWRVEIWRMFENATNIEPEELDFPAEEPVYIEWPEKGKEEVVCGSTATVHVISPGDRTYTGLYTVTPGEIGVDIYRNNSLYWSGTLDPEQYEEPYERLKDYDVTLCFQDFGILDRLKFSGSGMVCAGDLLRSALDRARVSYAALDISTLVSSWHVAQATSNSGSSTTQGGSTLPDAGDTHPGNIYNDDGTIIVKPILQPFDPTLPIEDETGTVPTAERVKATLDSIYVQASCFYDDGEPMTLLKAIEGVLQPLGQRIVQRAGTVYVYDLNGLAESGRRTALEWSGDSQTLSADKVAASVKITYDPNDDGTLLDGDEAMEFSHDTFPWQVNQQGSIPDSDNHYYLTYQSKVPSSSSYDSTDNHFTMHVGKATGLAFVWNENMCFKIVPQLGGSDAVGIIGEFYNKSNAKVGGLTSRNTATNKTVTISGVNYSTLSLNPLFRTKRVFVPAGTSFSAEYLSHLLRLKLEVLFDPRFNPFVSADDENNYKAAYDNMRGGLHYMFVPAELRLYDSEEGGNLLLYYNNRKAAHTRRSAVNGNDGGDISLGWKMGEWLEDNSGQSTVNDVHCWLAYYDKSAVDSRYETTGVFGWKGNRHQIGATNGKLMADMAGMPDGEYIPLPPKAGWLEVTVYDGTFGYVAPVNSDPTTLPIICNSERETHYSGNVTYNTVRWILYKHPTIEVVSPSPQRDVVASDEVVTEETANADAKEPLEIDTICGTMDYVAPSSRGQLYRLVNLGNELIPSPIHRLSRSGKTDSPEKLWIRTLFRQYASRHTILSGENYIQDGALCVFTEQNQGLRIFMVAGEAQDLIADTAESTFVELSADSDNRIPLINL